MTDFRFALRQLLKSPGFTAVAVLTLAFGIGANAALFSVVDQLLVRPLPVPHPERLALVVRQLPKSGHGLPFSYPLFRDLQRVDGAFSQLAAMAVRRVGLGTGGQTEPQRALLVSGNYFAMLGIPMALGRSFASDEGVSRDDAAVVVLSHDLWRRRFGADPRVLGRSVNVNGKPVTVIGVTPNDFTGTTRGLVADLYVPITLLGQLTSDRPGGDHPLETRSYHWLEIMGRLKGGVTHSQAQEAMVRLKKPLSEAEPQILVDDLRVLPGRQGFMGGVREARLPLSLLLATAGLVLLIACANLANLQLARAAARARDQAIRTALGASWGRLARESLMESLLLALAGGLLGVGMAVWLVALFGSYCPPQMDLAVQHRVDRRVLFFIVGTTLLAGLFSGVIPTLRTTWRQRITELKGHGTDSPGRPGGGQEILVVVQVGLSLCVLTAAGLCVRSLVRLQNLNPGFEPFQVVLASFDLALSRHSASQAQAFYAQTLERVRSLPGVEAAGLSANTPLSGRSWGMTIERIDNYQPGPDENPAAEITMVSDGYFKALGIPLLLGRDFGTDDLSRDPPSDRSLVALEPGEGRPVELSTRLRTIVVNEAFTRRYWPGQNPIGKHVGQQGEDGRIIDLEVVGVVGTIRSQRLRIEPDPTIFYPLVQQPGLSMTLAVRSGLEPATALAQIREAVRIVDSNVPVSNLRTMIQQRDDSLALPRLAATLLSGFGMLALLLAALGIYGLLAYSVNRRTREIGVRMALGAQIGDVVRLVLRQGFGLVGLGLILGLAGALGATRLLSGFLFEVQPLDPITFVSVVMLLGFVSLFACWLPARRAARVDPMVALRSE